MIPRIDLFQNLLIKKKIYRRKDMDFSKTSYGRIFVICFVSLLFFSVDSSAGGNIHTNNLQSAITGRWKGVLVRSITNRIPVHLQIEEDRGELVCELDYGPDRSCFLKAVDSGCEKDTFYFRFKESDGGWCDRLINGSMSIKVKNRANTNILLDVFNSSSTVHESVELERQ